MFNKITLENLKGLTELGIDDKRQIVLPKEFCDKLGLKGRDKIDAYLFEGHVLLKTQTSYTSVMEDDIKMIIQGAVDQGFAGEDLVDEIAKRIGAYNSVMSDHLNDFNEEIKKVKR